MTVEHVAPRLSRYEFFFSYSYSYSYERPHAALAYRTRTSTLSHRRPPSPQCQMY